MSDFGLYAIGQIAVNVQDLERAVAFYRDVLGMRFLFQAPPNLAFFSCGEVRLMLDVPEDEEFRHPASVIYYKVPDIVEAYRALVSKGVSFMGEPHVIHKTDSYELWMAFFRDPEGNVLALMTEIPKAT